MPKMGQIFCVWFFVVIWPGSRMVNFHLIWQLVEQRLTTQVSERVAVNLKGELASPAWGCMPWCQTLQPVAATLDSHFKFDQHEHCCHVALRVSHWSLPLQVLSLSPSPPSTRFCVCASVYTQTHTWWSQCTSHTHIYIYTHTYTYSTSRILLCHTHTLWHTLHTLNSDTHQFWLVSLLTSSWGVGWQVLTWSLSLTWTHTHTHTHMSLSLTWTHTHTYTLQDYDESRFVYWPRLWGGLAGSD